ncbi:hypothetical protein HOK51_07260 [Candidatus Woesearchaeota archaeon]|jgi:hypothetical protein|nr:hypothetical protein [Candidatus Woesearchaeota archaeon]MBT6519620.1 hypothetical protein [Candidatus Woesearchaeota archaeon]MBT7367535.1 hypothetical protein [Candidatus Woesearchaeota archaeon]
MAGREGLIELLNEIVKNQRLSIDKIETPSKAYNRYEQQFISELGDYDFSDFNELFQDLDSSKLVYVSNFHTIRHSTKNFIEILKKFLNQPIQVGLECIMGKHQRHLDKFMNADISESQFLELINYNKNWGFDWNDFRLIFNYAKKNKNVSLFGLNSRHKSDSLRRRDDYAAKKIVQRFKKNIDQKFFIQFGEFHLSRNHLPKKVNKIISESDLKVPKSSFVLQDIDEIYWDLVNSDLEDSVEVTRLDNGSFCILTTTPLFKHQSHLNYLAESEESPDYEPICSTILSLYANVLKLNFNPSTQDLVICSKDSFEDLDSELRKAKFSQEDIQSILFRALQSRVFFIEANHGLLYLGDPNINHIAEGAARYLRFILCGPDHERTMKDSFYTKIIYDSIGFFGSKLINPKRRHKDVNFFKKNSNSLSAEYVLQHKKFEKNKKLDICHMYSAPLDVYLKSTKYLGRILGAKLYDDFRTDKLGIQQIRRLFFDLFEHESSSYNAYMGLINRKRD